MISYVLPTRDRPAALARTLAAIGELGVDAEAIVVDNGSDPPAAGPRTLADGTPVRLIRLAENLGAAARNRGAEAARGDWLVMLDDDSHPVGGLGEVLADAAPDVAAIGAEIVRPGGRREAGGLPEVFVGCGAAVRRDAFLAAGGYDPAFEYYVEEYDLCARLLAAGHRVRHDRRFGVVHHADATHREMEQIVRRLVRNSCWVVQRYAPDADRRRHLLETITRYAAIAVRESAATGFARGTAELLATVATQRRRPLDVATFDRFTGLAAVRGTLNRHDVRGRRVAVVERGKHDWAVEAGLVEAGAHLTGVVGDAEILAIGTLSPGPMWDAAERWAADGREVLAWL